MKVAVYKCVIEIIEVDDKFKRCNEIVDDNTKSKEWTALIKELVSSVLNDPKCFAVDAIWELDDNGQDFDPIIES